MAFLVQWFTWLVTTITELKLLSVNFSKLLIILVYPVEWGQTKEWRMLILPGTCWPTLRGERDVAVTSLVRVYTTSELKDCGGMCIMHAYLSSMLYSGSWRTLVYLMLKMRSTCFVFTMSLLHGSEITFQSLPGDGIIMECQQKEIRHQCKFGYRGCSTCQTATTDLRGSSGSQEQM